ncbi:MAG: apolipoprotein N-acyltransferase [Ruminococcaceae bacterium]|nr:apolipoprotein N-acyltransferase [Oscillospiraceae bacterium]
MPKKMWLLLPFSGVLMGVGVAFSAVGFLCWLAPVPAMLFFFRAAGDRSFRLRRLYLAGFVFFFSFYLTLYHWFLALYPLEFMGISKAEAVPVVAICWLGLSLLQTVFSALVLPLFGALCRTRLIGERPMLVPLLFAAQWTVSEWSQTLTFAGVPWGRLSLSQIDYGFLSGSASLFGSYAITLCILLVSGYLALAILSRPRVRLSLILAASVFLLNALCGMAVYLATDEQAGTPVKVAAVQGNVGSDLKWTLDSRMRTYEIYARYTKEAAQAGAEIVLFPETFVPETVREGSALATFVSELASRYEITVYFGAFSRDAEGREYNAVFEVRPDGTINENVYAKRHLVPFGEYVPWRPLVEAVLPMLAELGMLTDDLTPGTDSALFEHEKGSIGTLICFDSIYESLTLSGVRDGAELILLPTNDSWFTDSAAVYMHESQARLRAVESGRWIVRAADTGISALISPNGRPYEEQGALVEGMAMGTVYLNDARTLYSYIGNSLVYVLIGAVLSLPLLELFLFRRKKALLTDPQ